MLDSYSTKVLKNTKPVSLSAVRQSIIIIEICRGIQGNSFRKGLPTLKVTFNQGLLSYAKDTLTREVNSKTHFGLQTNNTDKQSTQSLYHILHR